MLAVTLFGHGSSLRKSRVIYAERRCPPPVPGELVLDILGHAPHGRFGGVDIAGRIDRDAFAHGAFGRVGAACNPRRSSIARVKADCRLSNEEVERCVLRGLEHPI